MGVSHKIRGGISPIRQCCPKQTYGRPVVFWDFSVPPVTDEETFFSSYTLKEDLTQRPNRAVARVDLPAQGAVPDAEDKYKQILTVRHLPEGDKLNKANICGVIVDVKTSPDFDCDDPAACILVTMQSPANWWMKIGTIPLHDSGEWKSHQLDVKVEDYFKALPTAGDLMFVLQTNKPAKGSVYFDHVGFLVR